MKLTQLFQGVAATLSQLPLPVFALRQGLACGVIGLMYTKRTVRLGEVASKLLGVLEYRGYDSTGGVFQDGESVCLKKASGAPSVVCRELDMHSEAGSTFCGQVRWATYGSVDDVNAQPHVVHCKRSIYGAHNGNVSNCLALKHWLESEGHEVLSDNDGEVLVHTVEHYFHLAMEKSENSNPRQAMREAIVEAGQRLEGSYAAIIVLPDENCSWAIKAGSSLYAGQGESEDDPDNPFFVVSSDLTAVLRMTRMVLPIRTGQFVEYTADKQQVYALHEQEFSEGDSTRLVKAGEALPVESHFSRLQVGEVGLRPEHNYYMDQEIADQVESARRLVRHLLLGSERLKAFRRTGDVGEALLKSKRDHLRSISVANSQKALDEAVLILFESTSLWDMYQDFPEKVRSDKGFYSDAGSLLDWIWKRYDDHKRRDLVFVVDLLLESEEIEELHQLTKRFVDEVQTCVESGGRILTVCSGTSYNAARTGALFFNDLCGISFLPLLPGEYRGQYNHSFRKNDVLLTISQSGETKDVIDVVDDIKRKHPEITHICLVNNVNSTLAQEKADIAIPLRCGPEIAVPATKSFVNQLTLLYGLALHLAAALGGRVGGEIDEGFDGLLRRRECLEQIPQLLEDTLNSTREKVSVAAEQLYLVPSLHILATRMWGVAREGALKIREVVLNHAEGIEATEFKHGPNTILGLNTGFGLDQVRDFTQSVIQELAEEIQKKKSLLQKDTSELSAMMRRFGEDLFTGDKALKATNSVTGPAGITVSSHRNAGVWTSLYRDYPLIYVTGPGQRDVELTITQINTHKIRGAMSIVIAEEHSALRRATEDAPMDNPDYKGIFIPLPASGDLITTTFSSILVLQQLALQMCLKKMALLDHLGVQDHGVHPDAPKNVSKSITVD
jgi:glutamine---fructose-6-phosphate transaminase (isomerizing)